MRDLTCRLPGSRLPKASREKPTVRVACPNCKRVLVHEAENEKARCPICGNVWAWHRRSSGIVSLGGRA